MDRVYVLSHTDLDGYLSGGLVEYYYRRFIDEDAEFKHKSWTYGRNLPSADYIKNNYDKVFIVDLCPDYHKFMIQLFEHFKDKLIWIDHHTKPDTDFYKEFKEIFEDDIIGLRADIDHHSSAALLTYKYFESKYNSENNFVNHVPTWLKYCSDFDCWNRYDDTIWQTKIMPLFSYLKGIITNPDQAYTYIQNRYNSGEFYDNIHIIWPDKAPEYHNYQTAAEIEEGQILYKAIRAIYKAEAKHGFEREITVDMAGQTLTLKAWICNTQNRSSVIFEQMDNFADYDVFIPYHFNGEKYFYSMYTYKPEIKCNEICIYTDADNAAGLLRFNGHEDAAGSNSEKFAFPKS